MGGPATRRHPSHGRARPTDAAAGHRPSRGTATRPPRSARRRRGLVAIGAAVVLLAAAGVAAVTLSSCTTGSSDNAATAAERARDILGHAPTGVAAAVIKRGSLVIAAADSFPPLSYKNNNGELTGFDVAVGKKVAKELGLEPAFVTPSLETVPSDLKQGKADVAIGSVLVGEGEGMISLSAPYYYDKGQLLVKKGASALTGVDGQTVGAAIQSVFYQWLKDKTTARAISYPSDADAITALEAGQVQAVLTDSLTAAGAIEQGKDVERSGLPLFSSPVCFAVKQGQKDLLKMFNSVIDELKKSGWLRSASKAWFSGLDLTQAVSVSASP